MPALLSLSPTIKKLLVYLISVASLTILSASSTKAYTTWTILVDVSQGADPPAYSFKYSPQNPAPNCPGLPPMSAQKAEKLHICPGDKVEWNIRAIGSEKTLTIHQNQGFQPHGSDTWFRPGPLTLAGVVSDPHDLGTSYEYCLAAYDNQGYNYQLYSHDPKIIIGGAKLADEFGDLQKQFSPLLNEIAKDSKETEKARSKAKKIEEEIEQLKKLLEK
jgi:hypothetical protein